MIRWSGWSNRGSDSSGSVALSSSVMRAVVLESYGGPEVLTLREVPAPVPGPDEVLVQVVSAGVNRGDVMQRLGLYPGPPMAHEIPGLEFAGRVIRAGERVTRWSPGDAVMGIVGGGAHAQCRRARAAGASGPARHSSHRCGGGPRGLPHGVGRARGSGRPHRGPNRAHPRGRLRRRHRGDPDRADGRRARDRDSLYGQDRGLPEPRRPPGRLRARGPTMRRTPSRPSTH